MTIPIISQGFAADEAALKDVIVTAATARGVTVVQASVTPVGSAWFLSSGEDGDRNIVAGLLPDTTARQMSGFTAADFDRFNVKNGALKGGYVNNDAGGNSVAIGDKVQAQTSLDATGGWVVRNAGTSYRYLIAANKNGIAVLVQFLSGASTAQGIIYLGSVEPSSGRLLQAQTCARIAAVTVNDPGVASSVTIDLDRNINKGLKDGSAPYAEDLLHGYLCKPLFAPVAASAIACPIQDFACVQRIPIVTGTLALNAGNTRFDIDASVAGKLTGNAGAVARRYFAGRGVSGGVGDIVRLMSVPNVVICCAFKTSRDVNTGGLANVLASWDNAGGQSAAIAVKLWNALAIWANYADPGNESNRYAPYRVYATTSSIETGLVAQPDAQGYKNAGALYNIMQMPAATAPDLSICQRDGKAHDRWRLQGVPTAGQGIANMDGGLSIPHPIPWIIGPGV